MTQKLDKEHIEAITSLRQQFTDNSLSLGALSVEKHYIDERLNEIQSEHDRLIATHKQLQQQESELLDKLKERYGEGAINIEQGTFTPSVDSGL